MESLKRDDRLVSRAVRPQGSRVRIGDVEIGGDEFIVIAGPCGIEGRAQIMEAAQLVGQAGARLVRGGAFKPRTSPYSFQGLGEQGLRMLHEASLANRLPTVTEVVSPEDVPLVSQYADALQVGARNMQNFALLSAVGKSDKPVILKRGLAATLEEFLMAAEYIALRGNLSIVLCERGIRSFDSATRNVLDMSAVALLRQMTHLPVLVDPSHATGRRELVGPMSRAAVSAGADGLMIEVHPSPERALSDGPQSLTPAQFSGLMHDLAGYVALEGRVFSLFAPPIGTAFETHRRRIDRFDEIIVRMLSERAKIALELAQVKSRLHLPVLAPDREAAVLDHVQRLDSRPIGPDAIARIYSVIIREMRDLATSATVGKELSREASEQPIETV